MIHLLNTRLQLVMTLSADCLTANPVMTTHDIVAGAVAAREMCEHFAFSYRNEAANIDAYIIGRDPRSVESMAKGEGAYRERTARALAEHARSMQRRATDHVPPYRAGDLLDACKLALSAMPIDDDRRAVVADAIRRAES